jgi:hypothetical protein
VTRGTRIEDDASPKQVSASVQGWHALIGYTGLAQTRGKRTHEWFSELLMQTGNEDFDVFVEAIREGQRARYGTRDSPIAGRALPWAPRPATEPEPSSFRISMSAPEHVGPPLQMSSTSRY